MESTVRTPQQLSQALRAERVQQQMTQVEAARNVGLLPKTISRLEQKSEGSSIDSLFRLLSALGLEIVIRNKAAPGPDVSRAEW